MPENISENVSSSLMTAASRLSKHDAEGLAHELFGVTGTAKRLQGERDENFLVRAGGQSFLLKISHPDEDRAVLAFQTRALLHVAAADPTLSIPTILAARDGRRMIDIGGVGGMRAARLFSYLPGITAADVPRTEALRKGIGTVLARFDQALRDFADPADTYALSWDLQQAAALRPLLYNVSTQNRRNVESALDNFENLVAPAFWTLRSQVIHNDLSLFNVLVDEAACENITGVIDFGDMIRAPLINDLAIAAAYHFGNEGDALAPVLEVVSAYAAINPIELQECDLLYDLIATRLAMTILITEWRADRHPENRSYILKNHPAACRGLLELNKLTRQVARSRFRQACGLDN